MKLIVGLGNYGEQYEQTRHNVGFSVIDKIAQKINVTLSKNNFNGVFYMNQDFILAKPYTYMNLSGNFVKQIVNFYKIYVEDIIVIYDDLDTPLGQAKMKTIGGSGGHKGMNDIIQKLDTENIHRLKIGIGRPKNKIDISTFVLSKFDKKEEEIINLVIDKSADAVISSIYNGFRNVMNNFSYKGKKNEINRN